MENREAFTGISAEPEESIDEVNWRQKRIIIKLQEARVTQLEVSVEAINKVAITIVAMLQEEEVMSLRKVIKQRK